MRHQRLVQKIKEKKEGTHLGYQKTSFKSKIRLGQTKKTKDLLVEKERTRETLSDILIGDTKRKRRETGVKNLTHQNWDSKMLRQQK